MRLRVVVGLLLSLATLSASSLLTTVPAVADNPPRKILSGWIPYYSTKTALPAALANPDLISEVTPFWYTLKDPQTIQDNYSAANPNTPIAGTIAQLQGAGYLVLPTITDGTALNPKTGKNVQLVLSNYLANPATEKIIVSTITNLVLANKYDGIDLDWEAFAYIDANTTWSTTAPRWVGFIQDLALSLHAAGKLLSVTTPPLFDPASGKRGYYLYSWQQIGAAVDRLRIMAYDYSTSSPGPIGPITWTESAVQYAISVMPASKVFIGIPGYGRDWVTKVDGTCPSLPINYLKTVNPTASAATFVMHDAANLATTYGATPTFIAKYGESTFTYQKNYNGTTADGSLTTCTATRTVWFQDAQSFSLRAALVAKYHLGGVAEWTFGMEDPAAFDSIRTVAVAIAPDPVVARLSASSRQNTIGDLLTLTANLSKRDTTPFVGVASTIEIKTGATDWLPLLVGSTGADGSLSTPVIIGENTQVRVRSDGSWDRLSSLSSELTINVARAISWNPPTSMKHGVTYVISGRIQPGEAGIRVQIDDGTPSGYSTFGKLVAATTEADGSYSIPLKVNSPGIYRIRIKSNSDSRFITSQSEFVTVLVR